MKLFAACPICKPFKGFYSFAYYEDRSAVVECPFGHRFSVLLQSQRFEVLLESGARALHNDFTSEAVFSFSAALERFYEFGLRVFFAARDLERVKFSDMFKEMSRQSERQVGAFLAVYALEMGEPYSPNPKISTFRNSVIHKGLIPNPEEALNFCRIVYAEIYKLVSALRARFSEALDSVVRGEIFERHAALPRELLTSSVSQRGIYNLDHLENYDTFDEAYLHFVKVMELETKLTGRDGSG